MPSRQLIQFRAPRCDDLIAVPDALHGLAGRQAGVVTRRQLVAAGLSPTQIRGQLGRGQWRGCGRQVVVLANGALSADQRRWVAVLMPGKPAALAGLSAAELIGLRGFEPDQVHIVVQHDTSVHAPAWVRLHESRRFSGCDITGRPGLPRTTTARSFVDAATWSTRPRRACAILCAAVQQRLTRPERLAAELRQSGPIRHAAIMRDIVGDIGGGGHTLAEIQLAPLALRAGLPPPRRQVLRTQADGKVRYVDAEFDLPDGTTLAVEIDGSVHLLPAQWWDDIDRQNEIVIGGMPMLRFASLTIRLDELKVIDQLRRMRLRHS